VALAVLAKAFFKHNGYTTLEAFSLLVRKKTKTTNFYFPPKKLVGLQHELKLHIS
jgi:hypothetical protein